MIPGHRCDHFHDPLGTIRAVAETYVSALDSEARERGWKACFNQFAAL
jgi:hypothetical protein